MRSRGQAAVCRRGGQWALAFVLAAAATAACAQDAIRGQRLFINTGSVTGKPVGNCIACHANYGALRELIANRGGRPQDAQSVRGVLERSIAGAQPGAANAKAQYRDVLTARDLADLAAYIARAQAAALPAGTAVAAR